MLSERLKLARKRSGLSLRALSSGMGGIVSAQAIGKYERGEMLPSSTVAIAMADALAVPLSHLLSPSRVSLESVEFRKLASTRAKDRAAVEGEVLDQVDRYLQVEEILGIDTSEQELPDGAPYQINAVEDTETAATSVRVAWNLGRGPIPDITALLEERGIKVFKSRKPLNNSGFQSVRPELVEGFWPPPPRWEDSGGGNLRSAKRISGLFRGSLAYPDRWMALVLASAGRVEPTFRLWSVPRPSLSNVNGSPLPANWGTWF